ncbi:hypothetical protein GCM10017559_73360 [Streptosporangium longisporum]|uniref:Uncharacterized protein n=1 Tax=Streptosporangium longisporum TaxID=46187 RepID=A0ABP6LBM5_9ACTN
MTVHAYAESTSCVQGGALRFHLARGSRAPLRGSVLVEDVATGLPVLDAAFTGPLWTLERAPRPGPTRIMSAQRRVLVGLHRDDRDRYSAFAKCLTG